MAKASTANKCRVYSIDLKENRTVYQDSIATEGGLACVSIHPSDSSEMMLYCHYDGYSCVYTLPYACENSCYSLTSSLLRKADIFRVKNGFLAFNRDSEQGCYFSPTGLNNWHYIGRLGLDHSIVDFVATSQRNKWEIYYHHTFAQGRPEFASSAFAHIEVDNRSRKVEHREIKIKHNKESFDRLEVLRITGRGYYTYVAFMQQESNDICISINKYGTWSYPRPLIDGQSTRLVDTRIVRDKIYLLILNENRLEIVRLVDCRDGYKIKDRREVVVLRPEERLLKGCFASRSSAMLVTY